MRTDLEPGSDRLSSVWAHAPTNTAWRGPIRVASGCALRGGLAGWPGSVWRGCAPRASWALAGLDCWIDRTSGVGVGQCGRGSGQPNRHLAVHRLTHGVAERGTTGSTRGGGVVLAAGAVCCSGIGAPPDHRPTGGAHCDRHCAHRDCAVPNAVVGIHQTPARPSARLGGHRRGRHHRTTCAQHRPPRC